MDNVISDLNGEKIVEMLYKKKLKKSNQQEFSIEKVIKMIDGKLYAKGYDKLHGQVMVSLLIVELIKTN